MGKTFFKVKFAILFSFVFFGAQAQMSFEKEKTAFPFRVSVAYNAVNDSPSSSEGFSSSDAWNMQAYPSRISAEAMFGRDLSIEGAFSYNEYQVGKLIDGEIIDRLQINRSYDLNLKYSFRNLFGGGINPYRTTFINHFDPYLSLGVGLTNLRGANYAYTIFGGGLVYWFSKDDEFYYNNFGDRLGVFGQAQAKAGADNNMMQLSLGLIYKFK